ncbi:MAG: type II/IV secretion system protein [Acidobacteria bacterium]|jgi:type II secretory ATPase GspE/PulE/Tfp pilus assembly ATPase PilB-like protein|nr:MAG: type II/IV secretion system protein [Acidobacteriota bacterium]
MRFNIPYNFLKSNGLALLEEGEDYIRVGLTREDPYLVELVERLSGKTVQWELLPKERIDELLKDPIHTIELEKELFESDTLDEKTLENIASEAPIVKFVNDTLVDAIRHRATDIHVEQFAEDTEVRYRIDGVLHTIRRLPKYAAPPIVSRVKIMAKLNIAEKRLPQDGKFSFSYGGQDYDVRVSTLPSVHGESVVMRLLTRGEVSLNLENLGFAEGDIKKIRSFFRKPYGMVLVTGPTGSGKTTTLYAGIKEINTGDKKIITVEDPVEYNLKGLVQVQVNPKVGLTFAHALRSILRQDPDVIMIGEIRDRETAEIGVQASLTGHLVLATLHTNDSASAFARLIDMEVEEFLIASSVIGVISQRLVRKICPSCKEEHRPNPAEVSIYLKNGMEPPYRLFRGLGCSECNHTGYKGRTVIGEVLEVSDGIRELIVRKADALSIKERAVREGMVPLLMDGLVKAREGITSLEEVLRVYKD